MKKILMVIALMILIIGLVGCGKKEAPDMVKEPVQEPEVVANEPAAPAQTAPAVKEDAPKEVVTGEGDVTEAKVEEGKKYNLPVDVSENAENLAEASCDEIDGVKTISLSIKNTGEENWIIYGMENPKGNVRITNRALVDLDAGCEPVEFAPGESTMCTTITKGVIAGENRISIQTPLGTEARVVSCP